MINMMMELIIRAKKLEPYRSRLDDEDVWILPPDDVLNDIITKVVTSGGIVMVIPDTFKRVQHSRSCTVAALKHLLSEKNMVVIK